MLRYLYTLFCLLIAHHAVGQTASTVGTASGTANSSLGTQALSNSFSTTTNAYSSGAVAYSGSYTAKTTGAAMLGGFSGSFSSDYCGAIAQAGVGGIGFSFGAGGPVIDNGCLMLRSFERIQQAASALGPSDPEGAALLRSASLEVLAEVDPRIRNIFVNKGLIVSPEAKALASNGSSLVGVDPQSGKDLTVKQIRPINQPAISSINKTGADENETSKMKSSAAFAK
jgi:hypothetical protein